MRRNTRKTEDSRAQTLGDSDGESGGALGTRRRFVELGRGCQSEGVMGEMTG